MCRREQRNQRCSLSKNGELSKWVSVCLVSLIGEGDARRSGDDLTRSSVCGSAGEIEVVRLNPLVARW